MNRLCRWAFGVAALSAYVSASVWSSAFAKNFEMLTRLLVPAYVAQNFAALCVAQDARFLSDLNGGTASVGAFAEHVKKEATFGLPESDAANVRVAAADTARLVARQELQLLRGPKPDVPAEALKRWCDRSAKHFILEIMSKHREKHDEFDRLGEAAKH
jgi:hypothetical protein